ncbi:septum formation protein Maf [bacterium]|nr:MAG: septum formation protein Maf [bacterium]
MTFPVIYLASSSPRRREILSRVGIHFETVPRIPFDERKFARGKPDEYAKKIAEEKVRKAILPDNADGIVIAFDTIVFIDGEILGKPKDEDEAKLFLKKLSGRWHTVYTGIAVRKTGEDEIFSDVEATDVLFSELTDDEIDIYVSSGEPMDKAGAYGIQELGAMLVEKVNGCFYNVVGLPLFRLTDVLSRIMIDRSEILSSSLRNGGV